MWRRKCKQWNVVVALALASLLSGGCQSPTDPDDVIGVDDFVEASSSPDPATADASSGRTYRVVRGNNQPDEILEFDWKTTFTVTIRLNDMANDSDLDLAFPTDITAATVNVQQATGGIVSPPTAGGAVYQDYVISQTSGNRYNSAPSSHTITFDVWYDNPNLRKEALITVTVGLKDSDGMTFSKTYDVRVSP
jgi:hypothetical protein